MYGNSEIFVTNSGFAQFGHLLTVKLENLNTLKRMINLQSIVCNMTLFRQIFKIKLKEYLLRFYVIFFYIFKTQVC